MRNETEAMKQTTCWKGSHRRLSLLVSAGVALGLASWTYGQCTNDCGSGDVAEGEPCLVDNDVDDTNGGCNSSPAVFADGQCSLTICGTASTYVDSGGNNVRDTDWYLVDAATLADADADGNGVVQIRSTVTSEFPAVTFIVAIGDPVCKAVSVVGQTGFGGPDCATGDSAVYTVILADHPNGIVVFVAPGNPGRDGVECDLGANDYILLIECIELFTACAPGSGPCGEPNGSPGCEDPECCDLVCQQDAFCCFVVWDQTCVDIAIEQGCVTGPGQGVLIATGSDDSIDGYMDVTSDGVGSQATEFLGGPAWDDNYNPVGGPLQNPGFATTTFLYTDSTALAMTLHSGSSSVWGRHGMFMLITADQGTSDTNGNGVDDTRVVDFTVSGGLSLDITCTQKVESFLALDGTPVATWTVTYDITNTGNASTFRIVRWGDVNSSWVGGAANDIVGTGTNAGVKCDRFVYIGEDGAPNFSITLSTNDPDAAYVGSKQDYDPDCEGPDPPFGSGTDAGQVWALHGFPPSYINQIAGVGQNADGESGTAPDDGCDPPHVGTDGSIGLQSTISLDPGESTTVVYKYTYGAITPEGADCGDGQPCPWDLDNSGIVGATDLLALLVTWG